MANDQPDANALKKRIQQDQQTIAFLLDEYGDEASLDEHAAPLVAELRARIAENEATLAALAKSKKPRR